MGRPDDIKKLGYEMATAYGLRLDDVSRIADEVQALIRAVQAKQAQNTYDLNEMAKYWSQKLADDWASTLPKIESLVAGMQTVNQQTLDAWDEAVKAYLAVNR